jgi:hypothetical protein
MTQHPDGGMFSIKLVHPPHLEHVFFTPTTSNSVGLPRLMNFSDRGHAPSIAAGIRAGHRAIVYVTHPIQKFVWAIEYTGSVQDGQRVTTTFSMLADLPPEWGTVVLPIRFLATIIDVAAAPAAQDVLAQTGLDFTPNAFPMKHISGAEYQKLFNAINWQLVAPC